MYVIIHVLMSNTLLFAHCIGVTMFGNIETDMQEGDRYSAYYVWLLDMCVPVNCCNGPAILQLCLAN